MFCWSERKATTSNLQNPLCSLELYKKPVDYRKKRIHLHSIKPLYLYVQAEVRRSDLDHNGFAEGRDGGKIRKKKYVKF